MKIFSHVVNRRKFLESIGITAGALTVKPIAWAQGRKEVSIAGKRIKTVDIHAHASIQDVEEVIRGTELERRIGGPRLRKSEPFHRGDRRTSDAPDRPNTLWDRPYRR